MFVHVNGPMDSSAAAGHLAHNQLAWGVAVSRFPVSGKN